MSRIGLESHPRDEPSRPDAMVGQQLEETLGADESEFSTRDRSRCREAVGDPARHGIEVESQADGVVGHLAANPNRGNGARIGLGGSCIVAMGGST